MSTLSTEQKLSWYDVSQDVKSKLLLASQNWENDVLSEQYINAALDEADNNLDVLIGAYRFFFYKGKTKIALQMAEQVLEIVQKEKKLPQDWEKLESILVKHKEDSLIRLYLSAYSAMSFLLAKLGFIEEAKIITERVKAFDKHREFCATTVFEVLNRSSDEDD